MRQAPRLPVRALSPLGQVSLVALLIGLSSTPAHAQLAKMRANAGTVNPASAAVATSAAPVRPVTMTEALARQQAMQTQAQQLQAYVQQARTAAYTSVQGASSVTDGISANGLNPIAAVLAASKIAAAGAAAPTANAAPSSTLAVNDPTGIATWQGASAPVQTSTSAGAVTVTITQTQQNALLSWQNFDVGANTTLQFVQKQAGIAQPGWTVVNRVVNSVNPTKILGAIKADGTVLILNSNGVIFGPGAQVNLNGLIASSLELGNFASSVTTSGQTQYFVASTIADRNTAFLQNGLLVSGVGGYQGQILSALLPAGVYNVNAALPVSDLGQVVVDTGASITSGAGGYIILAAPGVVNAGSLYATNGQVSLQAGENIGAVASAGGSGSVDANVRGLVLSSQIPAIPTAPQDSTPDQGSVLNLGYIRSTRGYISLGTAPYGTVENDGLLEATTSVSRNGYIRLTGGTVTMGGGATGATASGIVITPDTDGETEPQGTALSPPSFNTSQIAIGDSITTYLSTTSGPAVSLLPSQFTMGANAFIFAPSANVVIGADASKNNFTAQTEVNAGVTIAAGATIDVAGEMAVEVSAASNSVVISPAKQNELRDTPNYRPVTTDGSFTLNGQTLYVDATQSGVRSDGVAWQGSPLLEAGSAISQIPITAAGLMTKGGTISIDVGAQNATANLTAGQVPQIAIAKGAVFDIAGGWMTYDAGYVVSSELITASGGAVNIANADPNGNYVAVVNGFTATQPAFGLTATYYNAAIQGTKYVSAYDEGRDAGALEIVGSAIAFDATIHGDAFAGTYQLAGAQAASASSSLGGDPRKLQYTKYQLPAAGLFRIGSFNGSSSTAAGQDIVVYAGTRGSDTAGNLIAADPAEILLDAAMLNRAGLGALMLQTSGAVTVAAPSDSALLLSTIATAGTPAALSLTGAANLVLAPGGVFEIDAGRTVRVDANVRVPDGTVAAQTYQLTQVGTPGIGDVGNPFRTDDDIAANYLGATPPSSPFNIYVNGRIDVSGLWTNDYIGNLAPRGSAYTSGGSISLTVAPKAFVQATANAYVDLSGSLYVSPASVLDVAAGGYVSSKGVLSLTGTGGNLSLLDETVYTTLSPLQVPNADNAGATVAGQGVAFNAVSAFGQTDGVVPTLLPSSQNSTIHFALSSIIGFGFGGGGTFKLIAPDLVVAPAGTTASTDPNATVIPLDVLQKTGFGTLSLTSYHTTYYAGLFDNGSANLSAFLDTTQVVVGKGQTLDLSQAIWSNIVDAPTKAALLSLPGGGDIATLLTAAVPTQAWYQKPATLQLGGLMELDIEAGGTLTGAPQAKVITPKLFNAGLIALTSGTITQEADLPVALNGQGFGLDNPAYGGLGFAEVFGAANAQGQYQLNATNVAGLTDSNGKLLTNNAIFTTVGSERFLYFLGRVGTAQGIVLAPGSTTDLSGAIVTNPVPVVGPGGTRILAGTILPGGTISTAAELDLSSKVIFTAPKYGYDSYPDPASSSPTPPAEPLQVAPRTFIAQPGATLDVSGTQGMLAVGNAAGSYVETLEWSNGGTIALLSGGTLAGATVRAAGGTAQATGGTLEWLDPTIRASDPCVAAVPCAPGGNVAYASQITRAGFSTLVADGGMVLDGTFALSLNDAVLVRSPQAIDGAAVGANAAVTIAATPGTNATISAPYIALASTSGGVNTAINQASGTASVTFNAGAIGMDLFGGITFDSSIAQVRLNSAADIRLIGVDDRGSTSASPLLDGALLTAGNLTFDAARVYTTTGTGNLQRILEDAAGAVDPNPPSPYLLEAIGTSTITVLGDHMSTATPLSAGSYLQVVAGSLAQDGYLAAPLGRIDFGTAGSPLSTITFGKGSVTSVSGAGVNVPYGTTTNVSTYFFTPGTPAALTRLPSGDLTITGSAITVAKGATIDGAGGGSVFAYEFVSGTGGSRDVLSRFNSDVFSANGYSASTGVGYQYADQRQVYAIVPLSEAQNIALYDPVYSADYSRVPTFDDNGVNGPTNLYGLNAGMAVKLDGGGGIAAGTYVLMPAHYALLPGAYRIVENNGQAAPAVGSVQTLRDGSVVMGGTFAVAGTGLSGSQRYAFTIEGQSTFLNYSKIATTDGATNIIAAATAEGLSAPSSPLDAARVVLDPLAELAVNGTFDLAAAKGGNGSEVDILGTDILVGASTSKTPGVLALSNKTLANLDANSLLIGGERIENSDDTTTLEVSATKISVLFGAEVTVPELILAVGGKNSHLTVDDGANLIATGTLDSTRAGNYVITGTVTLKGAALPPPSQFDQTGIGSVLRVSNGVQRLVARTGTASSNANRTSTLHIGFDGIYGNALTLDTNGRFAISARAQLHVPNIALVARDISFGATGTIDAATEAKFAAAKTLTLASNAAITFDPGTTHTFGNLAIDAPGIGFAGTSASPETLTLNTGALTLRNSSGFTPACGAKGAAACGLGGNSLTINASALTFGSGTFQTYSFDKAVSLTASQGVYVEGAGSLGLGKAALTITAPFVIDRAAVIDPNSLSATASDSVTPTGNYTIPVTPDFVFATTGAVALGAGSFGSVTPAGLRAPGAQIDFGTLAAPVASLAIAGTQVTATAGIISVQSAGDITVTGGASLSTPGFTRSYGDAQDVSTVSAGGGTVNLSSAKGSISFAAGTAISVDSGIGNAGTLNLIAANGGVTLGATLDAGVTGPRTAALTLDSGNVAFDLSAFARQYGQLFEGALSIRTATGNLALAAGTKLKASAITLTADGGIIDIAGTLDTSGVNVAGLSVTAAANAAVNGGNIALWGMNGALLEAGSLLDTHTSGYADTDLRQASAGNVTIGIGDNPLAAITIASGATIDLAATRTQAALLANQSGNRLVAETVANPNTLVNQTAYNFVAADTGGTLLLRAPVVAAPTGSGTAWGVNISIGSKAAITGAAAQQVEGYHTWNLDQIAAAKVYSGVTAVTGGVNLDPGAAGNNLLSGVFVGADGTASIPWFVQNFSLAATDGTTDLGKFVQRPGVNLVSAGNITLVQSWNLAAGTLNTAGALAAGDLVALPELGLRNDLTPYYAVVSGKESDIVANYVSFLYRVGGTAAGQAGVFSFVAGGNLDIQGSINDGFFSFADKSDAAWINYQLGGGTRAYTPGVVASCGTSNNCGNVSTYKVGTLVGSQPSINIDLTSYYGVPNGSSTVLAPYDAAANSATAAGSNVNAFDSNLVSGDAVGFMQLFPLLPNGQAMQSSSMRLVAGASVSVSAATGAETFSANPLHVAPATVANVTVEGTNAYALSVGSPAVSILSSLDLLLATNTGTPTSYPVFALDSLIGTKSGVDSVNRLTSQSLTLLNWGAARSGVPSLLTADAEAFFTSPQMGVLIPSSLGYSGVEASLGNVVKFLDKYLGDYLSVLEQGGKGPGVPVGSITAQPTIKYTNPIAYANSLVRTGNGAIDVAASGNVDLTNEASNLALFGESVVYRDPNGFYKTSKGKDYKATSPNVSQVGGTAIYTAGTRVASTTLMATVVGTTTQLSVTPNSAFGSIAPQSISAIPSPKGYDAQAPVFADNGGALSISAGGSVLALTDRWSVSNLSTGSSYNKSSLSPFDSSTIGNTAQLWRVGSVGQDTEMAIAPKYFTSGVGALAGGNVTIAAGQGTSQLTIALDSAVTTTSALGTGPIGTATIVTLGRGDLVETLSGNLSGGQIDLASGRATVNVAGNVQASGNEYLQVRIADATFALSADGSIALAGVSALAAAGGASETNIYNAAGYYAPTASFSATATGAINYTDNRGNQSVPFQLGAGGSGIFGGSVLPPSVSLAALTNSLTTPAEPLELYPSASGELLLFSAGDISSLVIAMSDTAPSLLPGAFSAGQYLLSSVTGQGTGIVTTIQGLGFGIPGVTPTTSQALLRLYHDQSILHEGDTNPVRIFAGVDINSALINVPKEAEVIAGRDITNLYFTGQNVGSADTTVVQAGRDIIGTQATSTLYNLPYVISNDFVLGGPGNFIVQAGRNIGPFINSAVVNNVSYPGGIQTVGNLYDPWLGSTGANLTVLFGVAAGVDYAAFEQAYLDPANFAQLDGSLFVQTTDAAGNAHPDRTKQVYAPILAQWLRDNDPIAFAQIFGLGAFTDANSASAAIAASTYANTTAGNSALTTAAYGQSQAMYGAFTALNPLLQDQFLINDVYFNELKQPAIPTSTSFGKYYRGYWAIDTLFPSSLGYTDNLAAYTIASSSVSADHPLGIPVRNLVDGQPATAPQKQTGNANLELATLQTASGGNLTILGPGGNFIAGSVVRTSTQAASIVTRFGVDPTQSLAYGAISASAALPISSIPIGYEGVLTLNGGAVSAFVDGNFLVNQSRVFTEAGGDITMWSSNGNLNAGQGPRSASNFPPVTVATDLDGYSTVDSAGSVSGAGIGAFKRTPSDPDSSIILVAPAGTVDAGDAGVRASGNILVAAAHVANADSFSAGGSISGVPARTSAPASTPASASSSVAATAGAGANANEGAAPKSVITVTVDGFVGNIANCDSGDPNDPNCRNRGN